MIPPVPTRTLRDYLASLPVGGSAGVVGNNLVVRTDLATMMQAVPQGGSTGQVLTKLSASNYDMSWTTAGVGDMQKIVYDPTNINASPFARANQTGTQPVSTITGLGSAALSNVGDFASAAQGALAASALQKATNLSDLTNAGSARTNIGLGNVSNTSDANKPISTATQTALDLKANLSSSVVTSGSGVERVLLGVIRQDSENSGWYFISDANHESVGFSPTITQDDSEVTVTYSFSGSKVRSLIAVPDETFAPRGLIAGTSVGVNNSQIRFGLPLRAAIRIEDGTNTIAEVVSDPAWKASQFSLTQTSGVMQLTHPPVYDSGIPPTVTNVRGGGAMPVLGAPSIGLIGSGASTTAFEVQYDIPLAGRVRWTSATTFVVDSDCVGTFTATWSGGTSELTVVHPQASSSTDLMVGLDGHRFVTSSRSATGFVGTFIDSAGNTITTPGSFTNVTFQRTASLLPRKTATTRHWINFSRGYARANPKFVWSTGGNIWLIGVIKS